MKAKSISIIKGSLIAIAAVLFLSACENNEVDPFGSAQLKVVNAAPGSGSQKFILANIPYIGNLNYLEHSVSYHKVAVGNNLVTQYRDENDNDLYASEELDLDDNKTYTVYLTGESRSDAEVRLFEDNLSLPASGMAKVKFLHLSSGAPAALDFTDSEGNSISTNVARYSQSSYTQIKAGSLSIAVHGSGTADNLATLATTDFADGKIYTVFISGSAPGGYTISKISHN